MPWKCLYFLSRGVLLIRLECSIGSYFSAIKKQQQIPCQVQMGLLVEWEYFASTKCSLFVLDGAMCLFKAFCLKKRCLLLDDNVISTYLDLFTECTIKTNGHNKNHFYE